MIVSKFGGSSTTTPIGIKNILSLKNEDRKVYVFSAIGKTKLDGTKLTDLLINYTKPNANKAKLKQQICAKFKTLIDLTNSNLSAENITAEICFKYDLGESKNWLISRGEFYTAKIMAQALGLKFVPAEKTIFFENGKFNWQKSEKTLKKLINEYKNIVIPGFYGLNEITQVDKKLHKIELLKRGGGDLSACIIAKCLAANICEIWTDVDGIFEINPNITKSKIIEKLNYTDLEFMTGQDAKVVQKDCAKVLNGSGIELKVKNIFNLKSKGSSGTSFYGQPVQYITTKKRKQNYQVNMKCKNGFLITFTCQEPKVAIAKLKTELTRFEKPLA